MTEIRHGHVAAVVLAGLALVATSGCASQILAPPARFQPLESPRFVAPDKTAVELEGGLGGQIFAGDAFGGTVRIRHRVSAAYEVSGEASGAYISLNDASSDASRAWGAARVGVRGRFAKDFEHAWWGVGLGGGAFAGGGFITPDLGAGIGYVNPYVIPYLNVGVNVSVPLAARLVDTSSDDNGPTSDSAELTLSVRGTLGVEVPIGDAFAFDLGMTYVRSEEISGTHADWFGFAGKLSAQF